MRAPSRDLTLSVADVRPSIASRLPISDGLNQACSSCDKILIVENSPSTSTGSRNILLATTGTGTGTGTGAGAGAGSEESVCGFLRLDR